MNPAIDGRYELAEVVGTGGMGVVYAATDLTDGRRVAVKLLNPDRTDRDSIARMRQEAIAGRRIVHPHVVSVLDGGTFDGRPYVVMEYVAGRPLGASVLDDGPMTLRRAIKIATQALGGVAAIHSAGFVHGDMKSDNVLVSRGRHRDAVKIIDLGLARSPTLGRRDKVASGTPEYMAPEVVRGEGAIVASDIFSVGVILYELLTGTTPFGGGKANEIMRRQLEDEVIYPSLRCPARCIPIALERAIMRALDKDPAKRHASAIAFAHAIANVRLTEEQAASSVALPTLTSSAATREWTRPEGAEVPRRFPAATRELESESIREGRSALTVATAAADIDHITVACLELVHRLIGEHKLLDAARSLENTIEVLTDRQDVGPTNGSLWRLLLSLAALYDGLGDPMHARRTANAAREHAISVGSREGRERATELIVRFTHTPQRRTRPRPSIIP